MTNPRLPFLYPNLWRSVKSCEPNTWRSIRNPPPQRRPRKANFHRSACRRQDTQHQRYGPAAGTTLPPPEKPSESLFPVPESEPKKTSPNPEPDELKAQPGAEKTEDAAPSPKPETSMNPEKPKDNPPEETAWADLAKEQAAEDQPKKALDMVLQIPSPSELKGTAERHPHLEASPYEHHFDTYSLVQDLTKHGYTEDQAVTLMKAIRLMLAVNLDLAKEGLVSKSDTENETYLFRAACSELRTTLQTSRSTEIQRQRTQRAHQQHEADILNQKMTQDLMTLKEDMKAMFNTRKMAVQEDKRNLDGKISELNYEITVLLNSDAKSDVEGLRWVLTRRAALVIGFVAGEYKHTAHG